MLLMGSLTRIKKESGIKIFRYLVVALIVFIAAPDLNNKPSVDETADTVVRHEVVRVQEIEQPKLSKKEDKKTVQTEPKQKKPKKTGCEAYRDEIAKYDWNVDVAMAIMKAESGCRTTAVGDDYAIRGLHAPSCGLFQVRTLQGRPSCDQLQNPATNIKWAYALYGASGWKPWTVYNIGAYKKYL